MKWHCDFFEYCFLQNKTLQKVSLENIQQFQGFLAKIHEWNILKFSKVLQIIHIDAISSYINLNKSVTVKYKLFIGSNVLT